MVYKQKTNIKLITKPAFLPNTCYVRLWVIKKNTMISKNYFDFEYDNKHIQSVVKDVDLDSLYGLIDEFSENIAIKYAKWYSEKIENRSDFLLTDKEIFNWFKIDEQL